MNITIILNPTVIELTGVSAPSVLAMIRKLMIEKEETIAVRDESKLYLIRSEDVAGIVLHQTSIPVQGPTDFQKVLDFLAYHKIKL